MIDINDGYNLADDVLVRRITKDPRDTEALSRSARLVRDAINSEELPAVYDSSIGGYKMRDRDVALWALTNGIKLPPEYLGPLVKKHDLLKQIPLKSREELHQEKQHESEVSLVRRVLEKIFGLKKLVPAVVLLFSVNYANAFPNDEKCAHLPRPEIQECGREFIAYQSCSCLFTRKYSQQYVAQSLKRVGEFNPPVSRCLWTTSCYHEKERNVIYNLTLSKDHGKAYTKNLVKAHGLMKGKAR